MGLWDVLLFNIAGVLGPRWIAAAAHNGTSSVSLWMLAALLFFVPTAFIIVELSTRYPHEGGIYVWTKEAFGDFHGFVSGWCYWIYTFFYFPGLLLASVAMSVYIGGPKYAWLADNRAYEVGASFGLLSIAVVLNLIGLNIGKWLQNAGGVGTYVPLVMLVCVAAVLASRFGSVTHFTWHNVLPHWDWDTVGFWSQMAFAFSGMELVCSMTEEIKNPQRTLPRATLGSGAAIATIYIVATIAVLTIVPANEVNVQNGVFQAIGRGSALLGVAALGMIAAMLVSLGNAGGVGATVAGISRIPFVVGIDCYLPKAFGKIHPRWRTPYVAILAQGLISGAILLVSQISESIRGAYLVLVNATIIINFIPFLYMYTAAIRLAYRPDRKTNTGAVLIPGGKLGVWVAGILGFAVTALSIVLSLIPTLDVKDKVLFEFKVIGGSAVAIGIGLLLYWRGAINKRRNSTLGVR